MLQGHTAWVQMNSGIAHIKPIHFLNEINAAWLELDWRKQMRRMKMNWTEINWDGQCYCHNTVVYSVCTAGYLIYCCIQQVRSFTAMLSHKSYLCMHVIGFISLWKSSFSYWEWGHFWKARLFCPVSKCCWHLILGKIRWFCEDCSGCGV